MVSSKKIRKLKPDELDLLTDLFTYRDVETMIAENSQAIRNGAVDVYGLFCNGVLVGELHVKYEDDEPVVASKGKRAYLYAFRIRKEYRGKGLGRCLIKYVIHALEKAGYDEITIGVEDDNLRARKLYEECGFVISIARIKEVYQGDVYTYDLLLHTVDNAQANRFDEYTEQQMSRGDYLGLNALLTIAVFMLYEKNIASAMLLFGYFIPKDIAANLVAVSSVLFTAIGVAGTWKERTKENALQTASLSLAFLFMLWLSQYHKNVAAVFSILLLIIAVIVFVFHVVFFVKTRRLSFRKVFVGIRDAIFFPLAVAVPLMVVLIIISPRIVPTIEPEPVVVVEDNELDTYKDSLVLFREDCWKNDLTLQKKMDALQKLCNIECSHLGITPVSLETRHDDASVLGFYDNQKKLIYINTKVLELKSADACIETLCHEVFHHYQHAVCESDAIDWESSFVQNNAYFETAMRWRNNMDNYQDPLVDDVTHEDYMQQSMEEDADDYASKRLSVYMDAIAEY